MTLPLFKQFMLLESPCSSELLLAKRTRLHMVRSVIYYSSQSKRYLNVSPFSYMWNKSRRDNTAAVTCQSIVLLSCLLLTFTSHCCSLDETWWPQILQHMFHPRSSCDLPDCSQSARRFCSPSHATIQSKLQKSGPYHRLRMNKTFVIKVIESGNVPVFNLI